MTTPFAFGEELRWLSDSVWIPTALLPEQGLVVWKPHNSPNKAFVELQDVQQHSKKLVQLEASFDDDQGFLTSLEGRRLVPSGNDAVAKAWRAQFSDYQHESSDIWIPTNVEAGFVVNGKDGGDRFEPYLHIERVVVLHIIPRQDPLRTTPGSTRTLALFYY